MIKLLTFQKILSLFDSYYIYCNAQLFRVDKLTLQCPPCDFDAKKSKPNPFLLKKLEN